MSKVFRPFDPEQQLLLPPSLNDWLPEDHLARFVEDLLRRVVADAGCDAARASRQVAG